MIDNLSPEKWNPGYINAVTVNEYAALYKDSPTYTFSVDYFVELISDVDAYTIIELIKTTMGFYEYKVIIKEDIDVFQESLILLKSNKEDGLLSLSYYIDESNKIHSMSIRLLSIKLDGKKELIDELYKILDPYKKIKDNKVFINLITKTLNGYELIRSDINDVTIDLYTQYNDDIIEFNNSIEEKLNSDTYNKGIILLHGIPGTGKTTFIKNIIANTKKKVIYLSPDMAHHIADPAFIRFLLSYPKSILVIEDAENILKNREAGGNQTVSNILNITDGILGSALKYQVICTFNAPLTDIDPALRRHGRLIGEYEFTALTPDKTELLVKNLYGDDSIPTHSSMTLAEIYSMDKQTFRIEKKKKSFGFIS